MCFCYLFPFNFFLEFLHSLSVCIGNGERNLQAKWGFQLPHLNWRTTLVTFKWITNDQGGNWIRRHTLSGNGCPILDLTYLFVQKQGCANQKKKIWIMFYQLTCSKLPLMKRRATAFYDANWIKLAFWLWLCLNTIWISMIWILYWHEQ